MANGRLHLSVTYKVQLAMSTACCENGTKVLFCDVKALEFWSVDGLDVQLAEGQLNHIDLIAALLVQQDAIFCDLHRVWAVSVLSAHQKDFGLLCLSLRSLFFTFEQHLAITAHSRSGLRPFLNTLHRLVF